VLISENILRRLIREMVLAEGIYDPGILKAVFMAGGPGSGKSFVAGSLFGYDPDQVSATASASGLKLVNSDSAFEHFMEKAGIDPGGLADMPPEEFMALSEPEGPRGKAKSLTKKKQAGYQIGRLGLLIDGTGRDFTKISAQRQMLEDIGYDTFMVFVNTSLDIAQERNKKRKRKLNVVMVEEAWDAVQENMGGFQDLFGAENFQIVDNSERVPVATGALKAVNGWVRKPVENIIGKEWIETQLAAKGPGATLPKQRSN